jgi:hypothetical protein
MRARSRRSRHPLLHLVTVLVAAGTLAACSDQQPFGGSEEALIDGPSVRAIQIFDCAGSTTGGVRCRPSGGGGDSRLSRVIIGGQGTNVLLSSGNASYDSVTQIQQFDVTLTNLLNEAMGTPDGTTADPDGIRLFFASGPTVTSGTGSVTVDNPDGLATFTAVNQPYFAYHEILTSYSESSAKTWRLHVPLTVVSYAFTILVETDVQYLLVINELLANPGGLISDASGEWFEVYNAGSFSVDLQDLVISDSATTGPRPYHRITASVSVPPGGYAVLGNTTNTASNGGVAVDYAYGAALGLSNLVDAVKISRVYGTDTLTLDRTAYTSGAISAQNGISRELRNPALDNGNTDGSDWADASAAAVYGSGGRGTPKAQNSAYTP